jgi:hypothetical protein
MPPLDFNLFVGGWKNSELQAATVLLLLGVLLLKLEVLVMAQAGCFGEVESSALNDLSAATSSDGSDKLLLRQDC